MRGSDLRTGGLFSYVDLEQRVPESHPLRLIRCIVNQVLAALDGEFGKLYAAEGRPSIAPERAAASTFVAGVLQHPFGAPVDGTVTLQSALSLVCRSWRG